MIYVYTVGYDKRLGPLLCAYQEALAILQVPQVVERWRVELAVFWRQRERDFYLWLFPPN